MVLGKSYSKFVRTLMYGFLFIMLLTLAISMLNIKAGAVMMKFCLLLFILIPPISIMYLAIKSLIRKDYTMLICLVLIFVVVVSNILTNMRLLLQYLLK